MYYSIIGHILEVEGEAAGSIPGFSEFAKMDTDDIPIMSIWLNAKMDEKTENSIYQFTIDKGTCQFFKTENGYFVQWKETSGTTWSMKILVEECKYTAITDMNKDTDAHILSFSVWIAFGIAALYRQTVAIHASTVIYKGSSILFLGESGTGKSTQSKLWLQHIPDTELLNDDSPFIRLDKDKIPIVWGSPWSGKTPCYRDKHTPISAFIRLRQAPYNSIKRLLTLEAIGALQPSLPPIFASEPVLAGLMHECLSSILSQIPVYILNCLPNEDAIELVYSTLKREGRL